MKHKYTWRRNHATWRSKPGEKEAYKLLCTKEWVDRDKLTEQPISADHNATCPACLALLIPKKQKELNQMLTNLSKAVVTELQQPMETNTILNEGPGL